MLRAVLEGIGGIDQWISANRKQAAADFQRLWRIPQPIVVTALTRLKYGTEPISRDALTNEQRIADAFYKLELLPVRINVTAAVPRSPG